MSGRKRRWALGMTVSAATAAAETSLTGVVLVVVVMVVAHLRSFTLGRASKSRRRVDGAAPKPGPPEGQDGRRHRPPVVVGKPPSPGRINVKGGPRRLSSRGAALGRVISESSQVKLTARQG